MRKIAINIIWGFVLLTFNSCRVENKFYFDIKTQTICSFGKKVFYEIGIDNDSIKPNGCQYESILLIWNDSINLPPDKIKIDSIPDKYEIRRGGYKSTNKLYLKPNSTYTLSNNGLGGVEFKVKIWTNSSGKVTKTRNESYW